MVASFRGTEKVGGLQWYENIIDEMSPDVATRLFVSISGEWALSDPYLPGFTAELGGVPLAINLVARRAYSLTTLNALWQEWRRIGAKLAENLSFPVSRTTSLPYSIELSLTSNRMIPDSKKLFRLLGQLPDELAHFDIQRFLGRDYLAAVESIIAVGLGFEAQGRINILPPIREYSRHHHPPTGDDADSWPDKILVLAEQVGRGNEQSAEDLLFSSLRDDLNNIEAAFNWRLTRDDDCDELRLSFFGFRNLLTVFSKKSDIFTKFASHFRLIDNKYAEAIYLKLSGDIDFHFGSMEIAKSQYDSALRIFTASGSITHEANTLASLGDIETSRGNLEGSGSFYLDARSRFRQLRDKLGEANCLARIARIHFLRNQFEVAKSKTLEALGIYEDLDNTYGKSIARLAIGEAEFFLRDFEESARSLDTARLLSFQVGDERNQAKCLRYLGDIALECGQFVKSEEYFLRVVTPQGKVSWKYLFIYALNKLGELQCRKYQFEAAEAYWNQGLEVFGETDFERKSAFLFDNAHSVAAYGEPALASSKLIQAIALFEKAGDENGIQKCRTSLHSLKAAS